MIMKKSLMTNSLSPTETHIHIHNLDSHNINITHRLKPSNKSMKNSSQLKINKLPIYKLNLGIAINLWRLKGIEWNQSMNFRGKRL